jgi:hypothetical protein
MEYIIFGGFPEGGRVAERRSGSPFAQRFVRWLRFQTAKLELSSLFREQLGGGQELNGAYPIGASLSEGRSTANRREPARATREIPPP